MEPACSFQVPSLFGAERGASGLLGEKQLFEKFWKGTFKAVATPRLESVIVASITARTRVANAQTTACQSLNSEERKSVKLDTTATRNGHVKRRGHKRHSHRRKRSPSCDDDLSPRPKGKKKKRKSQRKRKRKRSPSHSLSPIRKKKKKKKKSSKKSKRHKYTSKKSKHRSSSLKHKRKDERRHKKSSRSYGRRRRRYRRSPSEESSCQSSPEDRHHVQKSVVQSVLGDLGQTQLKWKMPTNAECALKHQSILSTNSVLSSESGSQLLEERDTGLILRQTEDAPHDYDSGNDTSSPPSCKTAVSELKRSQSAQRLTSPDKHKFTDRDNGSDSGNSVTSYASLCKTYGGDSLSTSRFSPNGKRREEITLGCGLQEEAVKSCCSHRGSRACRRAGRSRTSSHSSSSSRYSGSYRHHSRSSSLSSYSSYSRSPSSSPGVRRRSSSRESSCRYSVDRLRDRRRTSSSRGSKVSHSHKVRGKRRRRKSYSPMKKRRRDSPSHLEARRITSARKRPIPYFRRSPSSSSSVSSWSSLFSRSRSRSAPYRQSHNRARSYSSYRSYSRSSSWNSIFGSRSRSRSSGLLHKCHRGSRH